MGAGCLRRAGGAAAATRARRRGARPRRTSCAPSWRRRGTAAGSIVRTRPAAPVGDDDCWLEVQPWAILCGAADATRLPRSSTLSTRGIARARRSAPGCAGPRADAVPDGTWGEGSAGGIWFSINMTLVWAAAPLDRRPRVGRTAPYDAGDPHRRVSGDLGRHAVGPRRVERTGVSATGRAHWAGAGFAMQASR